MIIFPAIDVLEGKVVRLKQGDFNKVTIYAEDVLAQAQSFEEQGATWVHIVDLEGARLGVSHQLSLVSQIAQETNLKIEYGGGIRDLHTLATLVNAGVDRAVIGTGLISNPDFVREAVQNFGSHVVAGVDARDGMVAIEGWREGTATPAEELISELRELGITKLVYTDISRDGMLTGIDAKKYREVARWAGFPVTASGGVTSLEDITALRELGPDVVDGVIVGRAIYEGAFTVGDALAAARGDSNA